MQKWIDSGFPSPALIADSLPQRTTPLLPALLHPMINIAENLIPYCQNTKDKIVLSIFISANRSIRGLGKGIDYGRCRIFISDRFLSTHSQFKPSIKKLNLNKYPYYIENSWLWWWGFFGHTLALFCNLKEFSFLRGFPQPFILLKAFKYKQSFPIQFSSHLSFVLLLGYVEFNCSTVVSSDALLLRNLRWLYFCIKNP